jgi:hypothetical protein
MPYKFCVLSLLTFAGASTAQQPASLDSGETTLKVTSRLTLVDVTATDSKGKPVHGLTAADFTVKEDGKPQAISSFEEYGAERPSAAPPRLPPNVYTKLQGVERSHRGRNLGAIGHRGSGGSDDRLIGDRVDSREQDVPVGGEALHDAQRIAISSLSWVS